MGLQPFRQGSFAAGELGPRLHGRHDLAKYQVGLRRARNFFLSPEGAALNRPGTPFVREAKDSAAGVDRGARLIPFIFSEDLGQAYELEFGQGYVRFHVGGATIADPLNSAQPYELATPYLAADLPRLKYAQQGDVVTLTCKGYDPRELRRLAHDSWELVPLSFDVPAPNGVVYLGVEALENVADATHPARQWAWQVTEIWEDESGLQWETSPLRVRKIAVGAGATWHTGFTYPLGACVSYAGQFWQSVIADNRGHVPEAVMVGDPPAATYPYWTPVGAVPDPFAVYESNAPTDVVLFPDRTIKLWASGAWTGVDGSRLVGRRVYRGRGTVFGYVGEFEVAEFRDTGDTPDLSYSPPQGRNPFTVFGPAGEVVRLEQPSVVTFHAERRSLLGTAQRPAHAFLSRTGDYYNFDRHTPALVDDAFELELAGRLREEVRWAVGAAALLIGTQSGVWAIRPPSGEVLGPGKATAVPQSSAGSSYLDPLVVPSAVGDAVLYVRTKGSGVRDLVYDDGRQGFVGSDLSLLAKHLFTGYSIKAWTFQEDPWSVAWLVRSDGKLLSLTYVRDQEVWAWAWHDTQGIVEDVCAIPEGTEDAVYLIVKRQIGDGTWHRYVERMASRVLPTEPVEAIDAEGKPYTTARVMAEEGIFLDSAVTARAVPAADPGPVVGGLGHLEGLQVVALADGRVLREDAAGAPLRVAGGQVVLPPGDGEGYQVVHVGLPYVSEFELLDLALPNANVRNQVKTVTRVAFELEASRGLEVAEAAGAPESEWAEWEQPGDGFSVPELFSGLAEVVAFSSWNKKGRAAVRQREPLPCTVLAVTREADVGGS
ncbi:hypothetical protein A2cp1_3428 [Anaeromyxobacter dehalogenans 2CP-1]|uniref:Uncharacterized protein n=1 Tax=Anaeromyxobacter dehalogenans (strain ATCC BAA-258 / DSM 21875 / 2CP-1) TaxID=455488 RepID=B8JHP6_ANAD2|nr:hypothetical protein [Anaeromyxobacter dehalogenans]ACL66758.1 hypothetical protein A2cp1_3428 [Anaeromyxobacter dehalogenans 2CP-1]